MSILKEVIKFALFCLVLTGLLYGQLELTQARVLPSLPTEITGTNGLGVAGKGVFAESTAEGKINYLVRKIILPNIKFAFIGVSILILLYYGTMLVVATDTEAIDAQKKNFLWSAIGFLVLGISLFFVEAIAPPSTTTSTDTIGNISQVEALVRRIIVFIEYLIGAVASFFIAIAAIRIITSQGDEEEINKQKKNFVWGAFGLIVVLLADTSVTALYEFRGVSEGAKVGDITRGGGELLALVQWVLQYLGIAGVVSIVAAGFYYVISLGDDEKTKRAKNMIYATILATVIIYSSYAIVYTIIQNG